MRVGPDRELLDQLKQLLSDMGSGAPSARVNECGRIELLYLSFGGCPPLPKTKRRGRRQRGASSVVPFQRVGAK